MISQNNQNIINIGIWYVEQFEKDNLFFIECLVTMSAVREIMIMVYKILVFDKKISPIEQWDLILKESIWNDAKQMAAGRLDNEQCIRFAKCLYVLKVL